MNKKAISFTIVFSLFLVIIVPILFQSVSAACVIQGYTKNSTGGINIGNVTGICEDTSEFIYDETGSNGAYALSWGGPADTCANRCGNVWINGTNSTFNIYGHPDDGYPMNSTTTAGWTTIGAHTSNITMYDTNDPLASFGTNPADASSQSSTITFDSKCSDDIGVDYILIYGNWSGGWSIKATNNSPINDTWWNVTISSIPDGTYKWGVYCNDTGLRYDWTDNNRTFTIDSSAPTITIVSPLAQEYTTRSIWFNVTTSENADWCGYSLNGETNITMDGSAQAWNKLNSSMLIGSHTVIFWCNDSSGNFGTASRSFSVDSTPPTITIVSPANITYGTQGIWFNATTNENADWCSYSLDGATNITMDGSAQSWTKADDSVSEGQHYAQFWCNDTVGNYGTTSIRYFTVDITDPIAGMGTNVVDLYEETTIRDLTFDLICTDNLGVDTLQLWTNISGTWALTATNNNPTNNSYWNSTQTSISNGYYLWGVYCIDNAGNSDWSDSNRTFTMNVAASGGGGSGGGGTLPVEPFPICDRVKNFIDPFGFLPIYSAVDFDNFFFSLQNETNPSCPYNKSGVKNYIENYDEWCSKSDKCLIFGWPIVGKPLREAGIWLEETSDILNSCDWAYTLFILATLSAIITIFVIYKKRKKKKWRR